MREHIEAARRDDVSVSMSFLDPHVVFDPSRYGGAGVGTAYGHEAFAQAVRHYVGAFEDYAYEVDRFRDLGSGAVLAVVTETGRGKGSGAPVERHFAALYTVIERQDHADHLLSKRIRGHRSRWAAGVAALDETRLSALHGRKPFPRVT